MKKFLLPLALFIFSFAQLHAQFHDTVWSENWEGDWIEDWYVDAGTWEVGEPSSGPGTSHTGINCAGTVLVGNYSEGVRSRLVRLTKFTVPSKDQNPRLRFWHWFSFARNDYGYVQIKTQHGDWQNISPQYYTNGSAAWTYASIDLGAYADSLVQIAFYFHSDKYGTSTYVSSGWYIDEVQLITGHYIFDSREGFENGLMDWSVERGTWELGHPTSGPDSAYSGDNCVATRLDGSYYEGVRSKFISPPFRVIPASESPSLRFWHWFSFARDDYGEVYIKTSNLEEWQIISNRFTNTSSNAWTNFYADLSDFADSVVQIGFYFHSDPYGTSTYVSSGWYIDEMKIDGIPLHDKIIIENDLGIEWLEPVPSPTCGTGKEEPIIVRVENQAERAVSNFKVEYSIDNGDNYVSETVFETIDPGESLDYSFRWKADMADEDSYNCLARVNVVYDINDTNDVVTATIVNDHPVFSVTTTDTECGKATGTAELSTIEGRDGPYDIYWTSGGTETKSEDLAAGIYDVSLTDPLGCSWTKSFTINDLGAPEVSNTSSVNDISCNGMNDGNISIVPEGGTAPYSYKWSNGETTQNISGLRMGQYDVSITDANGCAKNHSFTIEEPAPLKVRSTSTDASCGEENGSASLNVAGGTQPYSYAWSTGDVGSTATGLAGGLYEVMVTDHNGCFVTTKVSISEIDAPQIIVTSIDAASCGLADGAINISTADPTLQYKYKWTDGSTLQDLQNVAAGIYSVTVSNQDGSCSTSMVVEIPTKSPPPGEICMISVDSVTSANIVMLKEPEAQDGIISTNIYYLSKTGSYQYLNSLDPSDSNTTTDAASNTETTSYRYRITQVDGCGVESEPSPFHETMHTVVTPDINLSRANIFWNSYKGVDYDFFRIFRYSESFGMEIIDTVPKSDDKYFYTYTDLDPPLDDTLQYVIIIDLLEPCNSVLKAGGTHNTIRSNKSKKVVVKKSGSTGIDNTGLARSLNIYPNPSKGTFRVRMDLLRSQDVILRIYDAQGRMIRDLEYKDVSGNRVETIDLPGVEPGIYHLQLLMPDGMMSRSFVVE